MVNDDPNDPEVMAAHAKIAEGLMALRDASGCPGCYMRHLEHVAIAVEHLLADAEEAALGDAEDAEHLEALH